jgi:hypothetical protein
VGGGHGGGGKGRPGWHMEAGLGRGQLWPANSAQCPELLLHVDLQTCANQPQDLKLGCRGKPKVLILKVSVQLRLNYHPVSSAKTLNSHPRNGSHLSPLTHSRTFTLHTRSGCRWQHLSLNPPQPPFLSL